MTTFPVSDVPTLFPYLVANRKSKAMISNPYLATWREGLLAATQRGERSLGFGAQMQGPTGPQQYQVQFSTTEEHVQLIERAKTLMARQAPGKSLGELHLQAMKLLVAALEKQKFSVTERPRRKAPASTHAAPARAQLPELTQRVAEARQACSREPAGEPHVRRKPRRSNRH